MKKFILILTVMIISLGFFGCGGGSNSIMPGGGGGTFKIRLTDVPPAERGQASIVALYLPNSVTPANYLTTFLASRDSYVYPTASGDAFGTDWAECYLWVGTNLYTGTSGSYDLVFYGYTTGTVKVIRNHPLAVNIVNVISYSSLGNP